MKSCTVFCKECSEYHESGDIIQFVGISEDYAGRDFLKFICPVTGKTIEARVYANR